MGRRNLRRKATTRGGVAWTPGDDSSGVCVGHGGEERVERLTGMAHLSVREEAGSSCQPDKEGKGAGLPARGEKRKEWAGLLVGPRRRKERR